MGKLFLVLKDRRIERREERGERREERGKVIYIYITVGIYKNKRNVAKEGEM